MKRRRIRRLIVLAMIPVRPHVPLSSENGSRRVTWEVPSWTVSAGRLSWWRAENTSWPLSRLARLGRWPLDRNHPAYSPEGT